MAICFLDSIQFKNSFFNELQSRVGGKHKYGFFKQEEGTHTKIFCLVNILGDFWGLPENANNIIWY